MKTLARSFDLKKIRRSYAVVSRIYDVWGRLTEHRALHRVLQLAGIRDGMSVIEVAVGTGTFFRWIVRQNPSGPCEGIDLSEAMVNVAHRKMRGERGNFHLRVASAYALPFDNESFDVLVNTFMLDLLPEQDYPQLLNEFRRVLRPRGRMVIATMAFGHTWYHRMWYWLSKHFPKLLTNCRPISMSPHLSENGFEI